MSTIITDTIIASAEGRGFVRSRGSYIVGEFSGGSSFIIAPGSEFNGCFIASRPTDAEWCLVHTRNPIMRMLLGWMGIEFVKTRTHPGLTG